MTTKTDKAPNSAHQNECLHLRKFKDFLRCNSTNNDGLNNVEQRNNELNMRKNNETYPVTNEELKSELIMCIWNQLQAKNCPYNFQLPILHALVNDLILECQNTKDNDFMCSKTAGERLNELQYDLVKLQKFVANNLEKFLTRLTDNSEAGNLHTYAEEGICKNTQKCQCKAEEDAPTLKESYIVGFIKNKPRKMEDRFVCLNRFDEMYELKSRYRFFGVFDGHSGPLAANYATCHVPALLAKQLKIAQPSTPDDYRLAFEMAFMQADEQFSHKCISSGTTAVCALISETNLTSNLFVAWVGDSRALLVGRECSFQLVKSHKPDLTDEKKRIEDAGGTVMHVQGQWRVNGFLNVARSIGDYAVGAVIAEPDFVDVPLTTETYDFLVLGTDGLWDHVSEAAIVTKIYDALEDEAQQVADIPKLLIEMAKDGDSQDNITVVIVFLKKIDQIVNQQSPRNVESTK